jgi:hypothetical protein
MVIGQRDQTPRQGGFAMNKVVVASAVFLLVTLGGGDSGMGEQGLAPHGELRIVDTL